jgi:four helix bundle protein
MAVVTSFEQLEIWQKARELAKAVRSLTRKHPFCRDFRFVSQFNSAAGSVMDNVAEGFERDGNREFIQFLYISKGSVGEVRSQCYRAVDSEFIDLEEQKEILNLTSSLKFKIQGLIQVLKNSGGKGYKG